MMKSRRWGFFRSDSVAKLAGLFSQWLRIKKKENHSRIFVVQSTMSNPFQTFYFFFLPSMLGHRTRITNAVRCDARAWFFDGKRRRARKACYTRTAFVKVTQKSTQVIQVRQFQELWELVSLFLQRASRVAPNKFSSLSHFSIL